MHGILKTFLLSLFSRLHLNKKTSEKVPYSKLAGVSLLKPLKGVDPNLINNLETFFELDYPKVHPLNTLTLLLLALLFQVDDSHLNGKLLLYAFAIMCSKNP